MRSTRYRYSWREPGFFRMNLLGWRFVLIDTRVFRPVYTDRVYGRRIGNYLVRLCPER